MIGLTGFGNSAVRCLHALKRDVDLQCVITRHEQAPFPYYPETHLSSLARDLGITVYEDPDFRRGPLPLFLESLRPDLILVSSFHKIIPETIIRIPRWCINLHPSLLPKYRGKTPITWALTNGEMVTGVTAHLMGSVVDGGPIVAQASIAIDINDTDGVLRQKLARTSETVLQEIIGKIRRDDLQPISQDEIQATSFPPRPSTPITVGLREAFAEPGRTHNRLRAMLPFPGAKLETGTALYAVRSTTWDGGISITTEEGPTFFVPEIR